MTAREANCVEMKRRGAEYVAKQLAGKSLQEKLDYWRQRTVALTAKQAAAAAAAKLALTAHRADAG